MHRSCLDPQNAFAYQFHMKSDHLTGVENPDPDILLVGGGIMSATLGVMLKLLIRLLEDPGENALTVRNLDPWYAAFGVKPGEALYLAPQERVRLW